MDRRTGGTRAWQEGLTVALVLVAALYVAAGASDPWDFRTYYFAGAAWRAHADPYDVGALSRAAGRVIDLPFLYPPATLPLFAALSLLPLAFASALWLGLKSALLAALVLRWREVLTGVPFLAVVGVTLFGFDAAALWDLRTGNVAIVELALLGLGFVLGAKGRPVGAALSIAAASLFKVAPAAFLGLLAVAPGTKSRRLLAALAAAALLLAEHALGGSFTREWIEAVRASFGTKPPLEVNPSSTAILTGWPWAAYALAILLAAAWASGRLRRRGSLAEWMVLGVLLWVLLVPRVMIYSYVLVIVPALWVVRHAWTAAWARGAGYVLLMAQGLARLLPGRPPEMLAAGPFVLTLAVFALFVARTPRIAESS